MEATLFSQSIDIVQKAIRADKDNEYEKAYSLYRDALTRFTIALKYEKNESRKTLIIDRVEGYKNRAEELSEYLNRQSELDKNGGGGGVAAKNKTDTIGNDADDEEKKAFIIRMNRVLLGRFCSLAGTQDPLQFVHPNEDGTGSLTALWESGVAVVKTMLLAIEGGTAASVSRLTYTQQKRLVVDGVANSWNALSRVSYTIEEGVPAKAVLTFRSYRELLDVMYVNMQNVEHAPLTAEQFAEGSAHIQQQVSQSSANTLMMMQATGTAPTHYQNGVPHYGGIHF